MKETVLIVHGTYSKPREDGSSWYAPGSAFCNELDAALAAAGSAARCWAHLEECGEELRSLAGRATSYFSWSGENTWLDRSIAARQLRAEIERLAKRGWQWHVVAHSHGGNVVLEALDLENARGGLTGYAVLLGTPILMPTRGKSWMDLIWSIQAATTPDVGISWRNTPYRTGGMTGPVSYGVAVLVSLAVWGILATIGFGLAGLTLGDLLIGGWRFWLIGGGAVIVVPALYWYTRYQLTEAIAIFLGFPALREELFMTYPPRVMFINSERDEAFNFLSSVHSGNDPFQDDAIPRRRLSVAWLRNIGRAIELDAGRYPWAGWRASLALAGIAVVGGALLLWSAGQGDEVPRATRVILSWSLLVAAVAFAIVPGRMLGILVVPWRLLGPAGEFATMSAGPAGPESPYENSRTGLARSARRGRSPMRQVTHECVTEIIRIGQHDRGGDEKAKRGNGLGQAHGAHESGAW